MSIAPWAWEKPEWSEMYPSATTFRLENLHLKMLLSGSDTITVWQIQEVNLLLLILSETFPNRREVDIKRSSTWTQIIIYSIADA
jgi:hypothetical protein